MSDMFGPSRRRNPAKEIAARGKGCLAVLVALAVLGGGIYFLWDRATGFLDSIGETPDYTSTTGVADITVTVAKGSSLTEIGQTLKQSDVIRSTKAFDKAVASSDDASSVQAGDYRLRTQISAGRALEMLLDPGVYRIRNQVTVPEGLRLSAQLAALSKGTKIKTADFEKALKKPQNLGLPAYAKKNAEGVLFPDTYELTAGDNATSVLREMVTRYQSVASEIDLDERAKALGRDPYQLLIVASIIEKEVSRAEYRPKVAQVIYNRLDADMPLGLDSTVIYALKLKTTTTTAANRATKTPYNTYLQPGLPPGPISAPGKAALEAAANPESGNWLYFTTVNFDTGETKFAADAAGHDANVAEFRAWCQSHQGRCT